MDITVLGVTAALLAVFMVCCLLPMFADSPDDRGDGLTTVLIPRYIRTPPHRPRTWIFLALAALFGLVFLGLRQPSLPSLYSAAVSRVAVTIAHDPATVNGYVTRLRPALAFFAVAYLLAFGLVVEADLGRRLAVLLHAVLYLAMTILTQALMIVTGIASGWLVAPFGIEASLANLLIGGLVVMRLTFTTFTLPRSTAVRKVRRPRYWETALTCCALISVVALLIAGYAFISQQPNLTSAWQVFLPLYAQTLLFTLMFAPLWALWWAGRKLPEPGYWHPAVDIIVPAYNEEDNIALLLRSVDVAAKRYGGPVRVVVSNDGSLDRTAVIAEEEISRFRYARGEILTAPNGGQAAALNRGLAVTDAEIVVRVDADCVLGEDTLVYAVPWFANPQIGCVGAMSEPRTDTVTWFHRLRALECAFQFRFARLGQSLVDGIVVIPGTFTAFRRGPALTAGGFPVGMNGEDADLTMHIGRLGYRVAVDPRIRSYEDVPRTPGEFVEQRTRWARAGFHVFSRHMPLRCGSAGPRVWFWNLHRGFAWFAIQAGMVAPIFLLELALTHPNYRQNVVTFALLYMAGGGVSLAISLPYAIKFRWWRSILWSPTWFIYAFLRRLANFEAALSLPTRPNPFTVPDRKRAPIQPAAGRTRAAHGQATSTETG